MTFGYTSTFTGIGGFDVAMDAHGMVCTAQIEINPHRQKLLTRYWPDVPKGSDIREVHGRDLGRPDLVIGGFPCQDTSIAAPHRRGLEGARSSLFFEFRRLLEEHLRLVDETAARWVVIENPVGLLRSNNGRDMAAVVSGLEELGYGWAYRTVDGRHLGTSQRRERVLIVGHRGGDARPAWQVLADAESGSSDPRLDHSSGRPRSRPALAHIAEEHDGVLIFRKSRRPRSKEDYATWVPAEHYNTLTGFDAGFRQTHVVVADGRPRVLTLTEWERLQGFEDGWTVGMPDSARYSALGDAMCVPMATWLARRLLAVHQAVPMLPALAATS